jgi:hypothetical protein
MWYWYVVLAICIAICVTIWFIVSRKPSETKSTKDITPDYSKGFGAPDEIPIVKGQLPAGMDPYSAAVNLAFQSKSMVFTTVTEDGKIKMTCDGKEVVAGTGAEAANKLLDEKEEQP